LSKLPASSIGSATEEVVPAPAVEPVEAVTSVEERESGGGRLRPAARRARPGPRVLILLVFLALAVWMFAPAWSSPTTTTLEGGDGDPAIFMWFLRWVPYALVHGHDPLYTLHLASPDAVNLR